MADPQTPEVPAHAVLVADVAALSEAALAALYDRHAPLVFGTALRLTTDRGRAEDVVLDTFLALGTTPSGSIPRAARSRPG